MSVNLFPVTNRSVYVRLKQRLVALEPGQRVLWRAPPANPWATVGHWAPALGFRVKVLRINGKTWLQRPKEEE
jgi:hypothetical protein